MKNYLFLGTGSSVVEKYLCILFSAVAELQDYSGWQQPLGCRQPRAGACSEWPAWGPFLCLAPDPTPEVFSRFLTQWAQYLLMTWACIRLNSAHCSPWNSLFRRYRLLVKNMDFRDRVPALHPDLLCVSHVTLDNSLCLHLLDFKMEIWGPIVLGCSPINKWK